MADLERVRELAASESGLAVAVVQRGDGSPVASVVNAGVLDDPRTGIAVVGFVARGHARKLVHLRERPRATVVFRVGWEWVAVEGDAVLAGPDDPLDGLDADAVPGLLRQIYASAVGGTPNDWRHLDESMAAERHSAVLLTPTRIYSSPTA